MDDQLMTPWEASVYISQRIPDGRNYFYKLAYLRRKKRSIEYGLTEHGRVYYQKADIEKFIRAEFVSMLDVDPGRAEIDIDRLLEAEFGWTSSRDGGSEEIDRCAVADRADPDMSTVRRLMRRLRGALSFTAG